MPRNQIEENLNIKYLNSSSRNQTHELSRLHTLCPSSTTDLCTVYFIFIYFFSFTLYPAHSRVGRGYIVLRHPVHHFPPNSRGIACWVADLNAARNINLNKYFFSSSKDRTHNQSILQSHFVPLRYDWPYCYYLFLFYITYEISPLWKLITWLKAQQFHCQEYTYYVLKRLDWTEGRVSVCSCS